VTPTYGTYNYAKIKAEQLLNEIWDGECVSLLPSQCHGPQQNGAVTSSQDALLVLCRKEFKLVPPMYVHWVDVRDVARAHFWAATQRDMASGRYIVALPSGCPMTALAHAINAADAELKVATLPLPWAGLWAASWFMRKRKITSHFLWEKCGALPAYSNQKLLDAGFRFQHTDLNATVKDAIDTFHQYGILTK
jgi:nucleoside-diphosphate-sugar epimerase